MFPKPAYTEDSLDRGKFLPPGLDRTPYVTWILLGANLVLFLLTELLGGSTATDALVRLGAMEGQLIASGEYWRLFTAMFLHSGLIHLGFNLIGLLIFGQQLERLFGSVRFFAVYILAGLAGSVASYAFNISVTPYSIGIGASGAVFGILGALVAFFISNRNMLGSMGRQTLTGLLALAAINLGVGFVMPGIDNFAHMGGLLGGLLLGMAYSPIYKPIYNPMGWPMGWAQGMEDTNSILKRVWTLPVAAVALIAGVLVGDFIVGDTAIEHIRQAEEYQEQGDFALALESIDRALEIDPVSGSAYLRRALIMVELGNVEYARNDLGRAIRLGLYESDRSQALRILQELRSVSR